MQSIVPRKKKQGVTHSWVPNEDGLFECKYCSYTTAKRPTMSEHVSRKHAEEAGRQLLPFHCAYSGCDKKYQAKTDLNNHIRDFHEIVRVPCPDCTYSAKNKYAVLTHYSAKHMPLCTETTPNGEEQCMFCSSIMSKNASKYHVAICAVRTNHFTMGVFEFRIDE